MDGGMLGMDKQPQVNSENTIFFSRSDSDLQMWVFGVYANLLESNTNCD